MGSTDYRAAFASLSFVHYTSLVKQLLSKLFKLAFLPKTKFPFRSTYGKISFSKWFSNFIRLAEFSSHLMIILNVRTAFIEDFVDLLM